MCPDQAATDEGRRAPPDLITDPPACPMCHGRGLVDDIPCWRCIAGLPFFAGMRSPE